MGRLVATTVYLDESQKKGLYRLARAKGSHFSEEIRHPDGRAFESAGTRRSAVSWAAEAFRALKKIILLEERMSQLADRVNGLGRLMTDMDRRMLRLETKMEVYESSTRRRRGPKTPPE
jgi:hypothetical protein